MLGSYCRPATQWVMSPGAGLPPPPPLIVVAVPPTAPRVGPVEPGAPGWPAKVVAVSPVTPGTDASGIVVLVSRPVAASGLITLGALDGTTAMTSSCTASTAASGRYRRANVVLFTNPTPLGGATSAPRWDISDFVEPI